MCSSTVLLEFQNSGSDRVEVRTESVVGLSCALLSFCLLVFLLEFSFHNMSNNLLECVGICSFNDVSCSVHDDTFHFSEILNSL